MPKKLLNSYFEKLVMAKLSAELSAALSSVMTSTESTSSTPESSSSTPCPAATAEPSPITTESSTATSVILLEYPLPCCYRGTLPYHHGILHGHLCNLHGNQLDRVHVSFLGHHHRPPFRLLPLLRR